MELVNRPYQNCFIHWSKHHEKVLVLTADLTNSCEVGEWKNVYPERYFSMGMAEQNMMGYAAGLARMGFYPFIHTFAVFIYRRPYDQLAMSIAYPNLPVRFIGFLPGITTPGGVTHQAIDDIAFMRATPNMTVVSMGDATDIETLLDPIQAVDGPVYVRMLRGEVPRLFPANEPFLLNKARVLSQGTDLTILSEGICTEEAMRAAAVLRDKGVSVNHLHVSTLKPFTDPQILNALHVAKHGVITIENHLITGGLGSAVAELMAENVVSKKLVRLGLQDTYAHGASKNYLMKEYQIDAMALIRTAEQLCRQELHVLDTMLQEARIEAVHTSAKAEAL